MANSYSIRVFDIDPEPMEQHIKRTGHRVFLHKTMTALAEYPKTRCMVCNEEVV